MEKKLFRKKIVVFLAIAAAFAVGMFGGSAAAAGSYQAFVPGSYGTFTFDDGNVSNNNGHDHDFFIDTSDLMKLTENVDSLAGVTDVLNSRISALPEFIYDSGGKITGYKTKDGADTVFPFISSKKIKTIELYFYMFNHKDVANADYDSHFRMTLYFDNAGNFTGTSPVNIMIIDDNNYGGYREISIESVSFTYYS